MSYKTAMITMITEAELRDVQKVDLGDLGYQNTIRLYDTQ